MSNEPEAGSSADPGHVQPEAAEVESARLLANQAHDALSADGMSDEVIRRAADAFIAAGKDGDVELFVKEAREQWSGSDKAGEPSDKSAPSD